MKRTKGTIEEWKELGSKVKHIESEIMETLTNSKYQKFLDLKTMKYLSEALDKINRFKSVAEDRMLDLGHFPDHDDMSFTKIFYGKEEE